MSRLRGSAETTGRAGGPLVAGDRFWRVQLAILGTKEKSAILFEEKELRIFTGDGGGGNRTRVRKPSATASTHAFPET